MLDIYVGDHIRIFGVFNCCMSVKKECKTAALHSLERVQPFKGVRKIVEVSGEDVSHGVVYSTAGPLIVQSLKAEQRVSTGAHEVLNDPLVVQTNV